MNNIPLYRSVRSKISTILIGSLFSVPLAVSLAWSTPTVGQPAPAFTLPDSQGKTRSLDEFKGKYVVLEWFNDECPFVRKHYDSGNMQKLQQTYTGKGVIWLSIDSSASGKEGYMTADQANQVIAKNKAAPTAMLLDSAGTVGHLYASKNTPTMFIIDPKGVLIYKGGMDDRPTTDVADIQGAKSYVSLALDEALAGKPVSTPVTKPYGCSVKY